MSTPEPDMSWRIMDMTFPQDPINGRRVANLLRRSGILTLGELMESSEEEVWSLQYFNASCRVVLRDKLAEYGLVLKPARRKW